MRGAGLSIRLVTLNPVGLSDTFRAAHVRKGRVSQDWEAECVDAEAPLRPHVTIPSRVRDYWLAAVVAGS